jgi:hypothetical protein
MGRRNLMQECMNAGMQEKKEKEKEKEMISNSEL